MKFASSGPVYRAWIHMRERCWNPKCHAFKNYGARGISVCERWAHDFSAFAIDMGPRPAGHSLDRIDNDGNYEPDNCRWATPTEQVRNRRLEYTRLLTWKGETLPVSQWAERLGTSHNVLHMRLKNGWSVDDVLGFPIRANRPRKVTA